MARILLGVTGGIAAYKAPDLCSALIKNGHVVQVIMTEAAKKFITPLTLAVMSKNPVYDESSEWCVVSGASYDIKHISLSKWAELFVVAPATANTIAKMAYGIADNLLTSTYLALPRAPMIGATMVAMDVLIFPAMNTNMLNHSATVENLDKLRGRANHHVIMPVSGMLACGDVGDGKFPAVRDIVDRINWQLSNPGAERGQR